MSYFTVFIAVFALGGLTLLLSALLIIANRFLSVAEDPRLDEVEDMLPHANCGGCGFPSCRSFAEALLTAKALPGKCSVSSEVQREKIADYLHVEVGSQIKHVARLACAGGINVAKNKAHYIGLATCVAASQVGGGNKACSWGCLGFGDCAKVCGFGAIQLDQHNLPFVDVNKCTACGDCVQICPKDLFSLQPVNRRLWVSCKNLEQGESVLDLCQVGCTACARCAFDAPEHNIHMANNLPVIDYQKSLAGKPAIERCPTGAIVWIDDTGHNQKGLAAAPVARQSALPIHSTHFTH